VLAPQLVDFISYPYEWSFGQLRDAALLTLELQERALARGFTLRDASAYNVQFVAGRPLFIDTLSFEPREEGAPWAGYRQFCEHFLVPLALMSRVDVRTASLLRAHLEGVPLDLGSRLLPRRTWFRAGLLFHVHLHAMAQRRYADRGVVTPSDSPATPRRGVSLSAATGLVRSLRSAVESLDWTPSGTEWADYTQDNNYSPGAAHSKRDHVLGFLRGLGARTAWDLGANTGEYSRAAREVVPSVLAFDLDPAAVERNYRRVRAEGETGVLPLLLDLTNPSPALGWAHRERLSLEERGPADVLLALALVHHLAIGHNLPLERVAEFLARLGRNLIIEFVPKSDSQVRRLLRDRPDIFPDYTVEGFEAAFRSCFRVERAVPIGDSERSLYLMSALPWHEAA
jgi:ribosomal protein L11 methylase PrmA